MANVLIIEDDPLIVKIYTTRLSADGHTVASCENGQDALTTLQRFMPHLILLDIMMPKLDGFEFLTTIRKNEQTRTIPVLVYSNLSNEKEIARAKSLGATEFLIKANLTPTEVMKKINHYLPQTNSPQGASQPTPPNATQTTEQTNT